MALRISVPEKRIPAKPSSDCQLASDLPSVLRVESKNILVLERGNGGVLSESAAG